MVSPTSRLPLRAVAMRDPRDERLGVIFHEHFAFVWRSLRRLGVAGDVIDDAAQEVFVVASRRLDEIEPGRAKGVLFGTAVRVAADSRRSQSRRRRADLDEDSTDPTPAPDELVEHKRARELLDGIVAELPADTRPVFVLFELEGMTMAEIAAVLELAPGTVASRLRRAREVFAAAVTRIEARRSRHG